MKKSGKMFQKKKVKKKGEKSEKRLKKDGKKVKKCEIK